MLLGGKGDCEVASKIENEIKQTPFFNACGKYNLNQSASLIRQSSVVISHDTGLMHIAAAFKKKIISIWGNTVPEFGMYPYLPGEGSEIIEVKNLKCRPCSKIGFDKCPKKHFKENQSKRQPSQKPHNKHKKAQISNQTTSNLAGNVSK